MEVLARFIWNLDDFARCSNSDAVFTGVGIHSRNVLAMSPLSQKSDLQISQYVNTAKFEEHMRFVMVTRRFHSKRNNGDHLYDNICQVWLKDVC